MEVVGSWEQGNQGQLWSWHPPLTMVCPVWASLAGGGTGREKYKKAKAGPGGSQGGAGGSISPPPPHAETPTSLVLDWALCSSPCAMSSHEVPCHRDSASTVPPARGNTLDIKSRSLILSHRHKSGAYVWRS